MIRFKMKRNLVIDLIMLVAGVGSIFILTSMIVYTVTNMVKIDTFGVVILVSIIGTCFSGFFNTKCYITDNTLHINFMLTRKIIPLDKIKTITPVPKKFVASKMVRSGIMISYEGQHSLMDVTIALKDEESFIKYINDHK